MSGFELKAQINYFFVLKTRQTILICYGGLMQKPFWGSLVGPSIRSCISQLWKGGRRRGLATSTFSTRYLWDLMEIRYLCGGLNYWAEGGRTTGTLVSSSTWAPHEEGRSWTQNTYPPLFWANVRNICNRNWRDGIWTAPWVCSPHPALVLPGMLRWSLPHSPKTKPYVTMHITSSGKKHLNYKISNPLSDLLREGHRQN